MPGTSSTQRHQGQVKHPERQQPAGGTRAAPETHQGQVQALMTHSPTQHRTNQHRTSRGWVEGTSNLFQLHAQPQAGTPDTGQTLNCFNSRHPDKVPVDVQCMLRCHQHGSTGPGEHPWDSRASTPLFHQRFAPWNCSFSPFLVCLVAMIRFKANSSFQCKW